MHGPGGRSTADGEGAEGAADDDWPVTVGGLLGTAGALLLGYGLYAGALVAGGGSCGLCGGGGSLAVLAVSLVGVALLGAGVWLIVRAVG